LFHENKTLFLPHLSREMRLLFYVVCVPDSQKNPKLIHVPILITILRQNFMKGRINFLHNTVCILPVKHSETYSNLPCACEVIHEVCVHLYKPSTPERPLAVVVTRKEFSQVELEMWQGTSQQGGTLLQSTKMH
jgi:hypothetical protein